MNRLIDWSFIIAGASLVAHVVLCFLTQRYLRRYPDLLERMFAIPLEALSEGRGVRLLRARLYLPWVRTGTWRIQDDRFLRILILATRLTGLAMPFAALAFIALSTVQGVL